MQDTIHPFRDHALALKRAGFAVLPSKGKKPIIKHWSAEGSHAPGENVIADMASRERYANADVVYIPGLSGPRRNKGIIVLDGDSAEAVEQITDRFGQTPGRVITRRGKHLLYAAPGLDLERELGEPITTLKAFGIDGDIKHGRSIAVAPPSWHEKDLSFHYTWDGCDERVISDLPQLPLQVLKDLLREHQELLRLPSERLAIDGSGLALNNMLVRILANTRFADFEGFFSHALDDLALLETDGSVWLPEHVRAVAQRVWDDHRRKPFVPMRGHRGTATTDANEIRAFAAEGDEDAYMLLMLLRAEHGARWARQRYRNARDRLLELGRLVEVTPETNWERATYTLAPRALTPSIEVLLKGRKRPE
jgi:Bifunctional DNA primase/polymerase, N-terminal